MKGRYQAQAEVFFALADVARLRILDLLYSTPAGMNVTQVTERLASTGRALAQPTVSHHLRVLVRVGLVDREQQQSFAVHTFSAARLAEVAEVISGWAREKERH